MRSRTEKFTMALVMTAGLFGVTVQEVFDFLLEIPRGFFIVSLWLMVVAWWYWILVVEPGRKQPSKDGLELKLEEIGCLLREIKAMAQAPQEDVLRSSGKPVKLTAEEVHASARREWASRRRNAR